MRLHLLKERQSDGYIVEIGQEGPIAIQYTAAMRFETYLIIMPMSLPPEHRLFLEISRD